MHIESIAQNDYKEVPMNDNSKRNIPIELTNHPDYPKASGYDPAWVIENQMGPNVLWLAEALGQVMDLKPGIRVLDMGCGTAMSSVFLAKEYGVQVWANDLWISATDNYRRIQAQCMADKVFPIHAEAHTLPYAGEFFDAIVSLDSYHYYGTDDYYLDTMVKLLKPGGQIGIISPGWVAEFGRAVPEHLAKVYHGGFDSWTTFHSPDWWRWHWEKTRLVDVDRAELLPAGFDLWLQWDEALLKVLGKDSFFCQDIDVMRQDQGRNIGFTCMVARRR